MQDGVRAVARRADGEPDASAACPQAVQQLGEPRHPGCVVRVVDHDDPAVEPRTGWRAPGCARDPARTCAGPARRRGAAGPPRAPRPPPPSRSACRSLRCPRHRDRHARERRAADARACPSSHVIRPSITVIARPPSASVSRNAGWCGSSEKSQVRPVAWRRIASTRGSSAFSTSHPLRARDPGDDRLDLGELVHRVDAVQARWSSLTFVTTATSLCRTPEPRSSMPPRAVSSTATSGCLRQGQRGAAEPRVVARLAPGRRRRGTRRRWRSTRRAARRCARGARAAAPWWSCRSCRSPGSRGRRDRGASARSPGSAPASRVAGLGDQRRRRRARGASPPSPRAVSSASARAASGRRHGNATTMRSGSGPGRARTARRRAPDAARGGPRERRCDAHHRPPPLLGAGSARRGGAGHAEALGRRSHAGVRGAHPSGHRQRQLDGGAPEVEVRPVEDADLHRAHRPHLSHGGQRTQGSVGARPGAPPGAPREGSVRR